MQAIIGFEKVLSDPAAYLAFEQRNTRLTTLVSEVARAALDLKSAGGNPLAVRGVITALQLEDVGTIQRRIAALEAVPESMYSETMLPYRRLLIAALKAKARYVLNLH